MQPLMLRPAEYRNLGILQWEDRIRGYQRGDGTWIIDRNALDAYHEKNIEHHFASGAALKNKIVDFIKKGR